MKLTALAFAVAFAILTGPAFASQCPVDMAKIDAALVTATSLTAEELETVKKLRAKGEKKHAAGKHAKSVKTLAKAKAILGID